MEKRGKSLKKISAALILCVLTVAVFGTASSVLQTSKTISSAGSVKGVGVGIYWNSACTNKTTSINWGLLEPGSNKTVIVYIRNEGNVGVTLSKTVQNWNPSTISGYMTLNWDYAGQTISVNQVLQTKLTLVVSSAISGITSFTFDIVVSAIG